VNVCRAASSRAPRLAAAAVTAVAALLVTACQGSTPTATKLNPTAVASKSAAQVTRYLRISPAPGTKKARTADGITVTATHGGKISGVTVKTTSKHAVTGILNAGGTSWHTSYALPTGSSFTVTARGTDASGHPVSATSKFSTLTPATAFHTEIF
jgi:hypothetical protein